MKRRRTVVVAATVVVLVALAAVASLELGLIPLKKAPTTTICHGCGTQETVVDVIMPYLGTADNTTNPNRVINMSQGETKAFQVDVYPTVPLTFELGFNAVLVSSTGGGTASSGLPSGTFAPPTITVGANMKGPSTMTITVPQSASTGVYDAVVTATEPTNSSAVWGLYFELQVL